MILHSSSGRTDRKQSPEGLGTKLLQGGDVMLKTSS